MQSKSAKTFMNLNATASYEPRKNVLDNNIYENSLPGHESSRKDIPHSSEKNPPLIMKKSDCKDLELDWEFYDVINSILEYTNVVLNDLEIFSGPEIYSKILRSYSHVLPEKAIDRMLNAIYKITIDKNHRISNGRYNAMYSEDLIKSFSNIFCLYCLNVTSKDHHMQLKYFNLLMKLIYHNILLVNDKTL